MGQKGKNQKYQDADGIPESKSPKWAQGDPIASITVLTARERAALVRTLVHRQRIASLDDLESRVWSEIAHAVLRERRECADFIREANKKLKKAGLDPELLEKLAHLLETTRPHPLDGAW